MSKFFKHIMIEPTNVCNLSCPICMVTDKNADKKRGSMSFVDFKRVVEPVRDRVGSVSLYNFGEPFLAPDIIKMMDYLDENNIDIIIHTNGIPINKQQLEHFKDYKTSLFIVFSIDGVDQDTYSYYRLGGSFEKAFENLTFLNKIKKENKKSNIITVWQLLVNKKNEAFLEKAEEMAEKIGVDRLRFKTISINENHGLYDYYMPKNKDFHRIPDFKKNTGCTFINPGSFVVLWNGDVVPCCIGPAQKIILGNAFKENLDDIWNKKEYVDFRRGFVGDENSLCNTNCRRRKSFKIFSKEIRYKK